MDKGIVALIIIFAVILVGSVVFAFIIRPSLGWIMLANVVGGSTIGCLITLITNKKNKK